MKKTDHLLVGAKNVFCSCLFFRHISGLSSLSEFSSRIFLLTVSICLLCTAANTQQLHLQHFTVDDGLPSNEVYQVLQDSSQNLLVATDRGAVVYDGYSFSDIPLQNRLTGKPVYYVYKKPDGGTYFSGLRGFIYEHREDSLFSYRFNNRTTKLFNHPGILIANSISSKRDTLWISFNNDYNYNYKVGSCFVTKDGAVKLIENPDGIYFDLYHSFFYRQLSPSSKGITNQPVYITWPDGAVAADNVDLNWQAGYIRRLFYERCGDYDLFSIGRQLLVYKNRKKVSSYLFPGNVIYLAVAGGQFYVGFENKGFSVYRLEQGKVSGPVEQHLDGYSVTCIYKDHQEGLWFSTMENGLFYSRPSKTRLWESNSRIVSIEKRNGKVYVGHYSGLGQVFIGNKVVETFRVPLPASRYLIRFAFDQKDSLIAITDKGFYSRHQKGWQFRSGQDIILLAAGKDLQYGASAATAELHIYRNGEMVQKQQLSKRIISMFANNRQELWIGTWEGLLKYHLGQLVGYSSKSPVFKDRIVGINELPGGHLVVASLGNGLAVYKNGKVYHLNISNGLRSPIINSMEVDGDDIWIGTNKGMTRARFEQDSFRVVNVGLEAGLPSQDVHQFSVNRGWLYIKWVNRLVVINAAEMLKTDKNTRTIITSIVVNDKERSDNTGNTLSYKQNALTFQFTCTNLSSAPQQEYRYTLEGFDKTWHRTRERYVKYTNLPPGKYRFKVQAVNLQDNTLSTQSFYAFSIKPAFWQQWWFPVLTVGLLFLFLLFIFQLRLSAIKEKNSLLLELADNRQKVLVQLIHPHFVFNVLNTIQGAVLKQDKMVAASLIARFAKLMRLSMELSKEKWVSLDKETELLTKYFELEEIRSPGRFTYDIEVVPPLQPSRVLIPSMLIQPFIENAIKHGVMHLADKKGSIHIKLLQENGSLICTVDDNGIGRRQSERINQNRLGHQSSGIEITINRLRLLHREQRTAFVYEIIDKQDQEGQPQGTTIQFSIPYKISYDADSSRNH